MVKIGCDPEFSLINARGQREIFDYEWTGAAGKIKNDHGGAVGELNPTPDVNPTHVVENLKKLILKIKDHYPTHKLVAGGGQKYRVSTGGHIHLSGIPSSMLDFSISDYHWNQRHQRHNTLPTSVGNKLILALDSFVASRMQKLQNAKRDDASYNLLSKIKNKTYESVRGFEYRSTPSFIVSPQVTESVLATAQHLTNMWIVKPQMFDEFFASRKATASNRFRRHAAKFREYDLLYPSGDDASSRYYRQQIINFKTLVFNRSFDLADINAFNYWSTPSSGILVAEARNAIVGNRTIQLQPCQLKLVKAENNFSSEQVLRVIRFAVPEVKLYPIDGRYIPWSFRLTRDRELKPNTLYLNKNLRPFIKMPRGANFKLRFIELQSRTSQDFQSTVFFNSTPDAHNFIIKLFTECVRTRLRRKDAALTNSQIDDEDDE